MTNEYFTLNVGETSIEFLQNEPPLVEASLESDAPMETEVPVKSELPKFKVVAYTGVDMRPCGYYGRVVIDLEGIRARNKTIPVRVMHDSSRGVGHANKIYVEGGLLKAEGVFSRRTEYAEDVVTSAKNGFPWEVSVGGVPLVAREVESGATIQANGRTFKGPLLHVQEFELHEISFCDVAADGKTSAEIAANQNHFFKQEEETEMKKEQKKDETQVVVEEIAATENVETVVEEIAQETTAPIEAAEKKEECKAEAKSEEEADAKKKKKKDEEEAEDDKKKPPFAASYSAEYLEFQKQNDNRIAAINSVSIEREHEDLRAQAIDEGWTYNQFQTKLQAARHYDGYDKTMNIPKTITANGTGAARDKVIEAAIVATTVGESFAQKNYDEQTLNMAFDNRGRLSCFRDVFAYATQSAFYRDDANDMDRIKAAFTTTGLDKIFRNVANKALLAGYEVVGFDWKKFCTTSTAPDFKPFYTYRAGGDFTYRELTDHTTNFPQASFNEKEYINQVNSYGLKFSLSRKMIANDDLNAFTTAPRRLGEGAALTLTNEIFKTLLSNGPSQEDQKAFFSTVHKNYYQTTSKQSAALNLENLGRASTMFETQVNDQNIPLNQEAKVLLVPSSLKIVAQRLMNSILLNETTGLNDPQGTANPFAGRYEIVATPYLQARNLGFPNASEKSWYLFGDPNRISVIDVVFLNGVETPTIRQGDVGFDALGVQYCGVFDFGVKTQDWRGAVFFNDEMKKD